MVFPKKLKGNVETLVKGLCNAIPSERLPMKKGGTQNIKSQVALRTVFHQFSSVFTLQSLDFSTFVAVFAAEAWFTDFAWDEMANFTLTPPYKPTVKSKKDIANFSANKEDMPPQIPYKDPKTGWDKDFATSS